MMPSSAGAWFGGDDDAVEIRVRGFGFLGNRALSRTLELIVDPEEKPEYLTATQIEDGALLLLSQVRQEGYLLPELEVTITLESGETEVYFWRGERFTELPRPMRAREVEFRVHEGDRFYFESLEFEGLTVLSEDEASSYFISTGFLFETEGSRVFTTNRLEAGIGNLREILIGHGYEEAHVWASRNERDDATGAVYVTISVEEGPISIVREARAQIGGEEGELRVMEVYDREPFSRNWLQDRAQELRAEFYELGYPDAAVSSEVVRREREEGEVWVDTFFRVEPGPYIELGEVVFEGLDKTRERVLQRKVGLSEGEALNRVEVDRGRSRLSRLGIFESVNVAYEEVDEDTRNVIYRIEEGRELDVSLLFGYGSYEMLRVGLEIEQHNIFGRAHRSRMLLAQSMKASSIDYRYTVPELFGEDVHGFATLFALRREEQDFDRQEFGSSVGVQTFFHRLDLDAGLRYVYQLLESRAGIVSGPDGLDRATVSSVDLTLQRDQRDNPIYPERGHNTRLIFEVASDVLGGEVEYQRLEATVSYHREMWRGVFLHLGLHHGVLHTSGNVADQIPINRRFFMGGEGSVRGYLEGEASPRNEENELVGSETYGLINLEIEQALTPRWSVVAFSDSIGFSRRLDDYPFDESLFSIGLGIRYKTLIGPVRLEYGHNLNPREGDPDGAIHLSIGFPF